MQTTGLLDGCILSVRAGSTHRQAAAKPQDLRLCFPKGLKHADPKVDLLAPLGSSLEDLQACANLSSLSVGFSREVGAEQEQAKSVLRQEV